MEAERDEPATPNSTEPESTSPASAGDNAVNKPAARRTTPDGAGSRHTPAARGYHMPAEWEPHQGTWLSWPHNTETWNEDRIESVERMLAQIVRVLCTGETIHINVQNAPHEQRVRQKLKENDIDVHILHSTVRFHSFATNDAWCRDHGGIFVVRQERGGQLRRAVTDWKYNAWGEKYPPYDLDDDIPVKMARAMGAPRFEIDMVLEGGAVDVNGDGLLITTESCLLNPNRNPDMSRLEVEEQLREGLGAHKVLWLEGFLVGDDTDGHVDNIVRFVDENTVLAVREEDPEDENYEALEDNHDRLKRMTTMNGKPLRVIELPMPAPVVSEGRRLPASYANFYVANRAVLLPTYDDPNDDKAGSILQRMFPHRRIIPLDCRDVVWGCGAIHCLTQQVPAV